MYTNYQIKSVQNYLPVKQETHKSLNYDVKRFRSDTVYSRPPC